MKLHISKEGDTLYSLSDKYGVEPERILEANSHLTGSGAIARGMKIRIPSGPVSMQQHGSAALEMRGEPKQEPKQEKKQEPKPQEPVAEEKPMLQVQQTKPAPSLTLKPIQPAEEVKPNPPLKAEEKAEVQQVPAQPNPPLKTEEKAGAQQVLPQPNPPASGVPFYPLGIPEAQPFSTYDSLNMAQNSHESAPPAPNQPAYYKTEPGESAQSPLHVKWSGMNDGAVHPFAQTPSPAVPVSAAYSTAYPPSYNYPFPAPQSQMPYHTAYLPHVSSEMPYPGIPEPYMPQYPFVPFAASGDCGCGYPQPALPYALPKRNGSEEEQIQAADSRTVDSGAADAGEALKTKAEARRKTSVKKAKISSRADQLREFVKQTKSRPKRTRSVSTPWVND